MYGQKFVTDIRSLKLDKDSAELTYFDDRQIRYIWNAGKAAFEKVLGLDQGLDLSYFDNNKPVTSEEHARKLLLYRPNIIEIPITSVGTILWEGVRVPHSYSTTKASQQNCSLLIKLIFFVGH